MRTKRTLGLLATVALIWATALPAMAVDEVDISPGWQQTNWLCQLVGVSRQHICW